ncbi:MAG TPA: AraC family transcriptional regulator [Flavipsychrobacter sp.]
MIATKKSWPNVIINTTTQKEYRDGIEGTLTIFSNNRGQAYYGADSETARIGEDTYFISNEHQLYSIDIRQQAETFNIHFSTAMLNEMLPALSLRTESLLDNAGTSTAQPYYFYNRQYWKDNYFRKTVWLLQSGHLSGGLDGLMTEEILANLLQHMLCGQNDFLKNIDTIPVVKAATRYEVLARLSRAVDYIYQQYHVAISLDELAKEACMSKFHFLRMFKQIYGQTPYQFIAATRLDKAKQLLSDTDLTVKDIALLVGYEDIATFCRAFKRKHGTWPMSYRLASQ